MIIFIKGSKTSAVTNMNNMFAGALEFNQNISNWTVSKVTDMSYMFSNATKFNQDLSGWCVNEEIISKPSGFDSGTTTSWTEPKPDWGNCP